MYLNKSYILGNLTKDPETKTLTNGGSVTTFSLATNRVYKDAAGVKQEQVEYHNIVVYGRQAETCAQYLKKGQSALIEGRITTRSWDDPSGVKKYRTEIVADNVQFGPKSGAGASSASSNENATNSKTDNSNDNIDYGEIIDPNDIPF